MSSRKLCLTMLILLCLSSTVYSETSQKSRVLVISSYHREYAWTQETNEGLLAAFKEFGYFDDDKQLAEYTANDNVETSKFIMKKLWMDTKRKKSAPDVAGAVKRAANIVEDFKPNIIMLGDDNAAKYIGNQFLDTKIPIVFWGVNNTPVKYGLVDSIEKPGHNVTGVYQTGYYKEGIEFLTRLVPSIKTFAILSDDTASGRAHIKRIERLAHSNQIGIKLVETVIEHKFDKWKGKALELEKKVDAFFIAQYSGLMNKDGSYAPTEKVASWYKKNINIPEVAVQGQFVKQGMLCSADDSGYNQGYSAGVIAHDILVNGKNPATYPPRTPERGALIVNKKRAEMLGIKVTEKMGIEEYY